LVIKERLDSVNKLSFMIGMQLAEKYKENFDVSSEGPTSGVWLVTPDQGPSLENVEMDQSPINQNFELNKSRQKFHHSLKEHHKISNIPKFRCKML
jgi:hypothetical protein